MGAFWLFGCSPAVISYPTPAIDPISQSRPLQIIKTATTVPPTAVLNQALTQKMNTPQAAPTETPFPEEGQIEATMSATPRPTRFPTITPTPPACHDRIPDDGLLAIVTQTYNLSPDYEPDDLLSLNDYFDNRVTLGFPSQLRQAAVQPLLDMMDAMHDVGLQPLIVSAYRSHYAQSVAYAKWAQQYPDRVDAISARPGHSEHQLGTTVDFSSPELPAMTGDPDLQFHTYFDRTSEGRWLRENAHRFGFTMSYPANAYEVTGFHYEPWHFRFVGIDLATRLAQLGISFTEYQLLNEAPPCIPEN